MTRPIPPWLAPVLEQLELERPSVVTVEDIERIRSGEGVKPPTNRIIEELAKRGWLSKTGAHGAWEFLPADRAGPHSTGDPLLSVRGTLATHPEMRLAVALGTAIWMLDLGDRPPNRPEVAMPPGHYVPAGLKRTCRVVRHEARLSTGRIGGLPVHKASTVLVHLVVRPTDVRSWGAILESLPDLLAASDEDEVRQELEGRAHAARVRFAYLLSDLAPDLIRRLGIRPAGKVWFGPRRKLRRHDARWNVADTILPIAPADIAHGRST
jgi:hypothetical protein